MSDSGARLIIPLRGYWHAVSTSPERSGIHVGTTMCRLSFSGLGRMRDGKSEQVSCLECRRALRLPLDRAAKKTGRPRRGEERGEMDKVVFRIDAETRIALEELERGVGAAVRGRRSVLLRRLILEAHKKLREESADGSLP